MSNPHDTPELPRTSWSSTLPIPVIQVLLGIAAFVLGFTTNDPAGMILYGLAGMVLVLAGSVRIIRRPRLEIVDGELAIKGLTSVRIVPPSEVVEIRLLSIPRFGMRQHMMRLEHRDQDGDEQLVIFSRADLGTDPLEVAETLERFGFPVRQTDLRPRGVD